MIDIQKERENFQPKNGEKYWYISAENECGYTWAFWTDNPVHNFVSQFGIYRTKAEIKPIVALIRKIASNQEDFVLVPKEALKTALLWMDEDIDCNHVGNDLLRAMFEQKPILEKAVKEAEEK